MAEKDKSVQRYVSEGQFTVQPIAYHTHNGTDSPLISPLAGGSITVEDSATIVKTTTILKFTSGAVVTNAGNGEANVAITAGVAGSDTDIQFNDGGFFGGNSTFTYQKTTDTLTIGAQNVTSTIQAPTATTGSTPGGSLDINAGDGDGANGGEVVISGGADGTATGAILALEGGQSGGTGGIIQMQSGDGNSSGNNPGGSIQITGGAGNSSGAGGAITLKGGTSASGNPGDVIINTSAIATTAKGNFLVIPMCAGAPTGTPAGNGRIVYDTTDNKLYVYNGAWKSVTLT